MNEPIRILKKRVQAVEEIGKCRLKDVKQNTMGHNLVVCMCPITFGKTQLCFFTCVCGEAPFFSSDRERAGLSWLIPPCGAGGGFTYTETHFTFSHVSLICFVHTYV